MPVTYLFILYTILLIGAILFLWFGGLRTLSKKLYHFQQTRSDNVGRMPHVTKGIRMFISWLFKVIKDPFVWCDQCHSAQEQGRCQPPPPIDGSKMVVGELGRKNNAGYLQDPNKVYNTYNVHKIDDSVRIGYKGYWCRGVSFVLNWMEEMPRHFLCLG